MQSGLIRRIDNLGRVVIPRQVREYIGVGQNGMLEFAVKGDVVLMRKFSPLSKLQGKVKPLLDTLAKEQNTAAALLDGGQVIYSTQPLDEQILRVASQCDDVWQGAVNNVKALYMPLGATEPQGGLLLTGINAVQSQRVEFTAALLTHLLNC